MRNPIKTKPSAKRYIFRLREVARIRPINGGDASRQRVQMLQTVIKHKTVTV